MKYSIFQIIKQGIRNNKNWKPTWNDKKPKKKYDVIIIGGGGHGLATAYYLAKNHNIKNVAVLEKNWIGGGNSGRNTTIVRSNYFIEGNTALYEHSLKLWETLSIELNYNVMFSQRGHLNLVFSPSHRDSLMRKYNIMRLNGIDAEYLNLSQVKKFVPHLNFSTDNRIPILGGFLQKRAGTARHDAVNWGFARAASNLGVDIVQNCEVTRFLKEKGKIIGVETTQGKIMSKKIGLAVAGSTSVLAKAAGLGKLPIESHKLQAFVSEPIKPFLDTVVVYGYNHGHFYISQSDKGGMVFGGNLDGYNSYAQKGNLPTYTDVMSAAMAIMPSLGRIKVLRQWSGIMDMSMDGSPFICKTKIPGLYLNAGWCYGGFKAIPGSGWCFAYTIANDKPHKINKLLNLDRYEKGIHIDESGNGPFPKAH